MTFDEQMGTLAGIAIVVVLAVVVLVVGLWVLGRLMPYLIGLLVRLGVIE